MVCLGLGVVDFDAYQRICVHFIKDPEAIAKAHTEEFSFSNLIKKDGETSDGEESGSENSH